MKEESVFVPSAEAEAISVKASAWISIVNYFCTDRPNAGIRLQARGKLADGGQWNPTDWYKCCSYSKVEDDLLDSEWKQHLKELKGLPPPPPRKPEEVFGKESIVIEDWETSEVEERGAVGKTLMETHGNTYGSIGGFYGASCAEEQLQSSKQRCERLAKLGPAYYGGKLRGEWQGPDIPAPDVAQKIIKDVVAPMEAEFAQEEK